MDSRAILAAAGLRKEAANSRARLIFMLRRPKVKIPELLERHSAVSANHESRWPAGERRGEIRMVAKSRLTAILLAGVLSIGLEAHAERLLASVPAQNPEAKQDANAAS